MNLKILAVVIGISAILSTAGMVAAFSATGTAFNLGGGTGSGRQPPQPACGFGRQN